MMRNHKTRASPQWALEFQSLFVQLTHSLFLLSPLLTATVSGGGGGGALYLK